MKYRLLALAISLIVAGGIVLQATGNQTTTPEDENDTEINLPEMKEKYTNVQSPKNNTVVEESPVPIRFDVSENLESYQLYVNNEIRKSGDISETNIAYVDVDKGTHSYHLKLFNGTNSAADSTRTRTFTFSPGINVTLAEPVDTVESGQEVEFTYEIETDKETSVELFIDNKKAAEDTVNSDQTITTTVRDIGKGNHTWKIITDNLVESQDFKVKEPLPALEINSFSVQNSDDGWNARADVEARIETSYELIVNGDVATSGTITKGSSSLGIPLTPESGQNTVKIRFANEEGEFETQEETINAN